MSQSRINPKSAARISIFGVVESGWVGFGEGAPIDLRGRRLKHPPPWWYTFDVSNAEFNADLRPNRRGYIVGNTKYVCSAEIPFPQGR